MRQALDDSLARSAEEQVREIDLLQDHLHDDVAAFVYEKLKRRPMVLPVVVEVCILRQYAGVRMRLRRGIRPGLAAIATAVALAAHAAPGAAQVASERIIFESDRHGNWELYAMNADGSSTTRLTFDPQGDVDPTTPASGARIAFASGRVEPGLTSGSEREQADIYVMDADGSNVRRLTRDPGLNRFPSFSPDGSKIAFQTYWGDWDVDVMNADGSGRVSLTERSGNDEVEPAWSPDGSKIAFARSNRAAYQPDIYVMKADGSAPARLTTTDDSDWAPAWSPDGRRIVFHRSRITATFAVADEEVFVINADGSGETQLTDDPPRFTGFRDLTSYPSWSPDGTRIAFSPPGSADGGQEIYVMNADGSGPRALTTNADRDLDPAFTRAPDSRPLTGRTRLRPRRVTIAGRARCRRRSRRTLRCAVRLRGRVVKPIAGSQAGCGGGRVTVTVRFGRRRVASARTRTTRGCGYRVRKRFRLRTERRVRRLNIRPRFGGNDFFSPRAGKRRKIRVRLAEG